MNNKGVLSNAAVLAMAQGADYLVPLLAIPYLLRVIGVESYGEIVFAQAICGYFLIITEFGFLYSATRAAAELRNDRIRLSRLFWNVQTAKVLLGFACFIALVILMTVIGRLKETADLLLLAMLPVLGSILFPLWIFQGLERLKIAAAMMLVTRMAMLGAMLVYVKNPGDTRIAAALMFGATPVVGVASWVVLARSGSISWSRPSLGAAFSCLREGKHAFFATAASSAYRTSNAVVLGFLSTPVAVAYYALCEKLVRALQELNRPLAQASYPRMSTYASSDSLAASHLFRKLIWGIGGLGLLASLMLFGLSPMIVRAVGGDHMLGAAPVLRILSFVPLIGGLNLVLGVQTMHPFGLGRDFSKFVAISGMVNIVLIVPVVLLWGARGAAFAYLTSELVLLINLINYHVKQGPVAWRPN